MCGIAGYVARTELMDAERFARAHALVSHRGPDDEGYLVVTAGEARLMRGDDTIPEMASRPHLLESGPARVILGHRRLSIIDVSPAGHEPFMDETGRYALVYNGELFNYIEIRAQLEGLGRTFRSASDTEVVLQALIEWGPQAFSRFNGMWALALYDIEERSLLMSRDRFGIKPFFYALLDEGLAIASEYTFIRALFPGRFSIDDEHAHAYVRNCELNTSERTFWRGINELPPGSWARWDGRELTSGRYWTYRPEPRGWSEPQALEAFAELFQDSLRLRMRADVEVGTLLSGGLDSSLIVGDLHDLGLLPPGIFNSFTVDFAEDRFSERRYAQMVIDRTGVAPHFVFPTAQGMERDLDALLAHIEQPFRSLSVYSQYCIYRHVRETTGVKVVLNGQGGDELFGGYRYHYYAALGQLLASGRWVSFSRELGLLHEARGEHKTAILKRALGQARHALGMGDYFNQYTFGEVVAGPLREYLAYDDRTSMAFGVEARVPFLDYRLVEFAFSLPLDLKIDRFVNKRIERLYARGRVPDAIVDRTDKMGFVSPQEEWQRTILREPVEAALRSLAASPIERVASDPAFAARAARYLAGDDGEWMFAWRVYCLARWLESVS